jgi:6-phosphogluconolactonase
VCADWESGVSVLPWNAADGTIGDVCDAPQHIGQGPHPLRQSIPHPHGIHGDHLTDIIYAMDLGNDNVVQYTLDTETGKLSHLSDVHMGEESGPRGIVFHPSLRIAYVNCELGGTVVACAIDDTAGLSPKQTVKVYPADFVGDDHPDNFGKASFWTAEAVLSKDAREFCTVLSAPWGQSTSLMCLCVHQDFYIPSAVFTIRYRSSP